VTPDIPRTRRWLFADQLGPQYLDDPDQQVLLIESRAVFRRRRFHRAKAHLLLSALRHRAAELGEQALVLRVDTYDEALAQVGEPLSVVQPTSYAADRFVRSRGLEVLPEGRGFATTREDFDRWAAGRKRLLMEDFYRWQRVRFDLLMEGAEPVGGQWNLDHDNREPPPKRETLGLPEPWCRARTRSTRRCARTSTGGSATARCPSSASTARAGRRPPGGRRRPRWRTSYGTGWPTSARPRTPCSAPTRGCRTAPCPRRSTSACCTRWSACTPPSRPTATGSRR
jgi:hypothetical protein